MCDLELSVVSLDSHGSHSEMERRAVGVASVCNASRAGVDSLWFSPSG